MRTHKTCNLGFRIGVAREHRLLGAYETNSATAIRWNWHQGRDWSINICPDDRRMVDGPIAIAAARRCEGDHHRLGGVRRLALSVRSTATPSPLDAAAVRSGNDEA
jgi:hypothetical protein